MPVLLAHRRAGQQAKSITWHQLTAALCAGEAFQVVDVTLGTGAHHKLAGRDVLAAARARRRRSKQPETRQERLHQSNCHFYVFGGNQVTRSRIY
jgi:hypothetical protein